MALWCFACAILSERYVLEDGLSLQGPFGTAVGATVVLPVASMSVTLNRAFFHILIRRHTYDECVKVPSGGPL